MHRVTASVPFRYSSNDRCGATVAVITLNIFFGESQGTSQLPSIDEIMANYLEKATSKLAGISVITTLCIFVVQSYY